MRIPKDLGPAGLAYWKTIGRSWKLDPHQPEVLHQACKCLDVIVAAEADVERIGALLHDRFGQWKPNPAVLTIRDYRGLFARLVRELGLSTADDSRPPQLTGRYVGRS